MYTILKCENLCFHDYSFLLDVEENKNTIVGVIIFEQFDFISMKTFILNKIDKIHKMKSKLVKKLGIYWF
jgi:hypothetical protein